MPEGTSTFRPQAGIRPRLLALEPSPASVFVNVGNTPWETTKFPGIVLFGLIRSRLAFAMHAIPPPMRGEQRH